MNAHGVGGVFRAGVLVLCVFLLGCFLTLKWGDITVQSATAVFPVVVTGNAGNGEEKLTLQSLQKTPLDQRDPSLLPLARRVLIPPSSLPYNLDSVGEHSHGQAQLIKKLFRGKRDGFFIEAGALNGEKGSNTLSLETDLGWSGLLAEGDPSNVELVKTKQRKCHLLPHCLSLSTETMNVKYRQKFNVGKVMSDSALAKDRGKNNTYTDVTCFPLFGVLRAMGVSKVDYFSLDVEGNEMDVLRTIPFDELEITALSVEYIWMEGSDDKNSLRQFMEERGYTVRAEVTDGNWASNDYIFVKKGFNEDIRLQNIRTSKGEIPDVD